MSSPTLSVCLIYKDEEAFIREAIESIISLADEVVVVDSGSKDKSPQIIQELQARYPQKIKSFERLWPDDFSKQRNWTIDKSTGDWILFLDADERIFSEDHSKIKQAISGAEISAYDLPIKNYTNEFTEYGYKEDPTRKFSSGYILTHLHRLFRKDPLVRYEGILHERIEPTLKRHQKKTQSLDATIHHLGPLKAKKLDLEHQRYGFYEKLGLKKVEANANDAQAHWELGVVYQKQKKMFEAETSFQKARELSPQTEEFEIYYAMSLFQQGKWKALLELQPRFQKTNFFKLLAEAQNDSTKINFLTDYAQDFIQTPLFQFELSLIHRKDDLTEKYRQAAYERFAKTGLIEFIESSHSRRRGDFQKANELLNESAVKGCALAIDELRRFPPK